MQGRTALVGATGYTGRRVARRLADEGIEFVVVARNPDAVRRLEADLGRTLSVITSDVTDDASVGSWISDFDSVISCVGPYDLFGRTIARHAAERGCLYLDVTGEQSFVGWSRDTLHAVAEKSGATLLHSCAFESAYADLLAGVLCASDRPCAEITSFYLTEPWVTSPGTQFTMSLAHHRDSYLVREGQLVKASAFETESRLDLRGRSCCGYFVPYPEVLFYLWQHQPRVAQSMFIWDEMIASELKELAQMPKPPLESVVARFTRPGPDLSPSPEEAANQACVVAVRVVDDRGVHRLGTVEARDAYGMTVDVLVEIFKEARSLPRRPAGVLAPSACVSAERVLDTLRTRHGHVVTIDPG